MFAAVVFHSSLTAELSQKLELQQKRSLAVILGTNYRKYSHALKVTSLPRLDTLRKEACLKWALQAQRNPQHSELFPLNQSEANTRWRKKYLEYKCNSTKFLKSAVPYMTRALNMHDSN